MFSKDGDISTTVIEKINEKTLLKIMKIKMANDPEFKALADEIINDRAEKDKGFAKVLEKAKEGKYETDPEYQNFIRNIIKSKVRTDPVYRSILMEIIKNNAHDEEIGYIVKKNLRIEDHPEYNRFAREMKTQCMSKKGSYTHKAFKKNVPCYTCKIRK